ncbi:MAG TPA: hypothetical protein ENN42_00800 [Thioalkalivibrio sp.]|nr:hypothetical protein [Thioalkalivibrio sp.]
MTNVETKDTGHPEAAAEALRVQARLDAYTDLKNEIEPWLMEEREIPAREALANVVFHLEAEIAEQHRRLEVLGETERR